MSTQEGLSVAAIVISLAACVIALLAWRTASKVSADSAQATLFLLIDRDITSGRTVYIKDLHALATASTTTPASPQSVAAANALLLVSQENFCNVIDNACAQYLDGRLDKVRFKKTYSDSFRDHVRQQEFAARYTEGSKYQPTIKCIREWNPSNEDT